MARGDYNALRFGNLFCMGVLWTLVVILSYLKLLFQKVCHSPAIVSFPRSSPKNAPAIGLACIVIGASLGIGKETTEALTLHSWLLNDQVIGGVALLNTLNSPINLHPMGIS